MTNKDQTEYQTYSAIYACEARIENGADIAEAFNWLREEMSRISLGEIIYETN